MTRHFEGRWLPPLEFNCFEEKLPVRPNSDEMDTIHSEEDPKLVYFDDFERKWLIYVCLTV